LTVNVAAFVTTMPLKMARYCLPLSPITAVNEYVAAVAPPISDHEVPPLVETCHCTAAPEGLLAAENETEPGLVQTLWLDG
jgi:hypothetical protein